MTLQDPILKLSLADKDGEANWRVLYFVVKAPPTPPKKNTTKRCVYLQWKPLGSLRLQHEPPAASQRVSPLHCIPSRTNSLLVRSFFPPVFDAKRLSTAQHCTYPSPRTHISQTLTHRPADEHQLTGGERFTLSGGKGGT